jgi:hypothetical protein
MMKAFALALALCLTGGCVSPTPNYDAKFGDAVRAARLNMTINPDAGRTPDAVTGMDGASARTTISQYQGTFAAPPPVSNVHMKDGGIGQGR